MSDVDAEYQDPEPAARARRASPPGADLATELARANDLLERYGPAIERLPLALKAFIEALRGLSRSMKRAGPRTPIDFLGEALTEGRFDPLIERIAQGIGAPEPPQRRKRR